VLMPRFAKAKNYNKTQLQKLWLFIYALQFW